MDPTRRCIIHFLALFLYLFAGAGVFSYLEQKVEKVAKLDINKTVSEFLQNNPQVDVEEFHIVLREVRRAEQMGVDADDVLAASYHNRWDVINSFYFCTTVITTIGFGHLSPISTAGKVMFIFYALFGIPLMAWFLIDAATLLKVRVIIMSQKIKNSLSHCSCPILIRSIFTGFIFFSVVYLVLIVIPAIILGNIEDWTHVDAQYFCFVSITTIGFGDYVPTERVGGWVEWIYKLATTFYYFLGMTVLTTVACVLQDIRPGVKSIAHQRMMDNGGPNQIEDQMCELEERELALGHLALKGVETDVNVDGGMCMEDDDDDGGDGNYRKL